MQMYALIGDLGVQPSRELIGVSLFDEKLALSQLETGIDDLKQHVQDSGTVESFFMECDRASRPPVFARQRSHILNGLDCHIDELAAMRILMRDTYEFLDLFESLLDSQPIAKSEIMDLRMHDPQPSSSSQAGIVGERRMSITSIVSHESNTSLNSFESEQSQARKNNEIEVHEPSTAETSLSVVGDIKASADIGIEFNKPSAESSSGIKANESSISHEIASHKPRDDQIKASEPSATREIKTDETSDSGVTSKKQRASCEVEPSQTHVSDNDDDSDHDSDDDNDGDSDDNDNGNEDHDDEDEDKPIYRVPTKRQRSDDEDDAVYPHSKRKKTPLAQRLEIETLLSDVDFGEPTFPPLVWINIVSCYEVSPLT